MGLALQARMDARAELDLLATRSYQSAYLESAIRTALIRIDYGFSGEDIAEGLRAALEAAAKGPNHD